MVDRQKQNNSKKTFGLVLDVFSKIESIWILYHPPSEQGFLSCMALGIYEVVHVACLSRS